jgi:hypothetical protein
MAGSPADAMTSKAGPAPLSGLAFAAAIGVLAMANFMAVLDMKAPGP